MGELTLPASVIHESGEKGALGEPRIMDGFGGLKRYAVRHKRYRCRNCKHEFDTSTNHYSAIYTCPKCISGTSDCIEVELSTLVKRMEESNDGL